MREVDLEAICQKHHDETRLMGGPLFDRVLHATKVPQKRLRACLARLGLDKPPPPPEPFKSVPDVPYEEPERRELKQRVVHGVREDRPDSPEELRDWFDPR